MNEHLKTFVEVITGEDKLDHQSSFISGYLLSIDSDQSVDDAGNYANTLEDYIAVIPDSEPEFKAVCQSLVNVFRFIEN